MPPPDLAVVLASKCLRSFFERTEQRFLFSSKAVVVPPPFCKTGLILVVPPLFYKTRPMLETIGTLGRAEERSDSTPGFRMNSGCAKKMYALAKS